MNLVRLRSLETTPSKFSNCQLLSTFVNRRSRREERITRRGDLQLINWRAQRDILSHEQAGQMLSPQAEAARAELINIVNNFFYEKLSAVPVIKGYMEEVSGK